jgi:5'-phosphate synthase pdxT subunit
VTEPVASGEAPLVGILAIQGGFAAHARILRALGARTREVRTAADLAGVDALILPGGESTVMSLGLERDGLTDPLREAIAGGMPTLGTCAGMIMLDRSHLGVLPVEARRNAFGRQTRSFEAELELRGVGPLRGVFIRAPWIETCGEDVDVLAEIDGHPVAVRHGDVIAVAFHPELAGEDRLHRLLLDAVRARAQRGAPAGGRPRREAA